MIDKIKAELEDNELLYVTEYGSSLYGTRLPSSDMDYKGLFIPSQRNLILEQAPKTVNLSTNKNGNNKNTEDDVDLDVYSIQHFFRLMLKGDTNMVSILASLKHPDSTIYINERCKDFLLSLDHSKILSRNISGMMGYVKSQVYKYSIKGFKYTLIQEVLEELYSYNSSKKLKEEMDVAKFINSLKLKYPKMKNQIDKFLAITDEYGQDGGLVTNYFYVLGKHLNFNERIHRHITVLTSLKNSFGHRAIKSSEEHYADRKAVYHAFRVLDEIRQLHTEGRLTYPVSNADFLIEIRKGKYSMDYLSDLLQEKLEEVDSLYEQSKLQEKPDRFYINEVILSFYYS